MKSVVPSGVLRGRSGRFEHSGGAEPNRDNVFIELPKRRVRRHASTPAHARTVKWILVMSDRLKVRFDLPFLSLGQLFEPVMD